MLGEHCWCEQCSCVVQICLLLSVWLTSCPIQLWQSTSSSVGKETCENSMSNDVDLPKSRVQLCPLPLRVCSMLRTFALTNMDPMWLSWLNSRRFNPRSTYLLHFSCLKWWQSGRRNLRHVSLFFRFTQTYKHQLSLQWPSSRHASKHIQRVQCSIQEAICWQILLHRRDDQGPLDANICFTVL